MFKFIKLFPNRYKFTIQNLPKEYFSTSLSYEPKDISHAWRMKIHNADLGGSANGGCDNVPKVHSHSKHPSTYHINIKNMEKQIHSQRCYELIEFIKDTFSPSPSNHFES